MMGNSIRESDGNETSPVVHPTAEQASWVNRSVAAIVAFKSRNQLEEWVASQSDEIRSRADDDSWAPVRRAIGARHRAISISISTSKPKVA